MLKCVCVSVCVSGWVSERELPRAKDNNVNHRVVRDEKKKDQIAQSTISRIAHFD